MASTYERVRLGQCQTVRRFSVAEDEFITGLRVDGAGTTDIAKRMFDRFGIKRSQATINMRLKSLAAIEEGK